MREQEYQGYWHYLLDFRAGTWEYPIDNYRYHYACLTMFEDGLKDEKAADRVQVLDLAEIVAGALK